VLAEREPLQELLDRNERELRELMRHDLEGCRPGQPDRRRDRHAGPEDRSWFRRRRLHWRKATGWVEKGRPAKMPPTLDSPRKFS
jgi:hypothetical protein